VPGSGTQLRRVHSAAPVAVAYVLGRRAAMCRVKDSTCAGIGGLEEGKLASEEVNGRCHANWDGGCLWGAMTTRFIQTSAQHACYRSRHLHAYIQACTCSGGAHTAWQLLADRLIYSILFCSVLFCSILFYSFLFYSILFYYDLGDAHLQVAK